MTRMRPPELRALRRRMQLIFQDPYSSLNPRMTVREIVGEGISIFEIAKSKADEEALVVQALEKVGLRPDMMGRYPHEFSGGQRQRIGIARALAVEPSFIVCDEPVSALDATVQARIVNLLEALQDELEVSYLFISHDLRVVAYTSHRLAVMVSGRIVEMGPTADVAEKRHHPYTRALFSAVPSIDAGGTRRLVLHGEPPSALDPPKGCVFHPRCPKAEPGKCDVEAPPPQRGRRRQPPPRRLLAPRGSTDRRPPRRDEFDFLRGAGAAIDRSEQLVDVDRFAEHRGDPLRHALGDAIGGRRSRSRDRRWSRERRVGARSSAQSSQPFRLTGIIRSRRMSAGRRQPCARRRSSASWPCWASVTSKPSLRRSAL